jgi:uncharacterized membrane protein YjfL (UPF0719 family)
VQQGFDLESFDPDEIFLLLASLAISVIGFVRWLIRLRPVSKLGAHPLQRVPLYGASLVGFAVIALVVWRWADQQIRDNTGYVLLVFLMGGAWLTVSAAFFPWLGTGLRDDAFERRNCAATLALSGAVLAILIIFAAATAGEGPSFWNNVFSGGLATGVLFVLWLVVAIVGGTHISISEERDIASGLRLGGFLLGQGLILARAIAGDWHSSAQTVQDLLRDGWIAGPLAIIAVFAERALRPDKTRPNLPIVSHGVVPAVFYLAMAIFWAIRLGWWEGALK